MRLRFSTLVVLTASLTLTPVAFAAARCGNETSCDMPCCKEQAAPKACCTHAHNPATSVEVSQAPAPARQFILVTFDRPVWIGRRVLMGKYVIEHDTDRQARGEPCTRIYEADDFTMPVVAFHCVHLESDQTDANNSVVLQSQPDGTRKLLRFQFAGETAAHGYPRR